MLRLEYLAIVNDTVEEGAGGEVLQGRSGRAVVQQELGGQQDQGLLEGSVQLAAQRMEHLRRRRGIHNKHVGQALCVPPHVLHHHLLPDILHTVNMPCQTW